MTSPSGLFFQGLYLESAQRTMAVATALDSMSMQIAITKPWTGKKVWELKPDWEMMECGICDDPAREKYLREVLGGKIGP